MTEIDTMTREQYESAVHFGTAGPASLLDQQTVNAWQDGFTGWAGKFWLYTVDSDGITVLRPLNVTNRRKT